MKQKETDTVSANTGVDDGKRITQVLGVAVKLWTVSHSPKSLMELVDMLARMKDSMLADGRHDDAVRICDVACLVELVWCQLLELNLYGLKWGKEEVAI